LLLRALLLPPAQMVSMSAARLSVLRGSAQAKADAAASAAARKAATALLLPLPSLLRCISKGKRPDVFLPWPPAMDKVMPGRGGSEEVSSPLSR